jgi:uncharacterized protein YdaU (DUF1376 family)
MTGVPGMMLWTDAYLADTQHLTTVQHGAYLLILMAMWRNGGSLPNDEIRLSRCAGMTLDKWRKVGSDVRELLTVDGGQITQRRLKRELEKTLSKIEKRRAAGRRGGEAKARNNQEPTLANATDLPEQKAALAPETKTQTKNRSKKDSRTIADAIRPPDPDFDRFWAAYPERKGGNPKKPARSIFEKLIEAGAEPEQLIASVRRYADLEAKNIGTRFIQTAETFLNKWSAEDYVAAKPVITITAGTPEWTAWRAYYVANDKKFSLKQIDEHGAMAKPFPVTTLFPPEPQVAMAA